MIASDEGRGNPVEPLLGIDLPIEVAGPLDPAVVHVPGSPTRELLVNGRRNLDGIAVVVFDLLAPAILDATARRTSRHYVATFRRAGLAGLLAAASILPNTCIRATRAA